MVESDVKCKNCGASIMRSRTVSYNGQPSWAHLHGALQCDMSAEPKRVGYTGHWGSTTDNVLKVLYIYSTEMPTPKSLVMTIAREPESGGFFSMLKQLGFTDVSTRPSGIVQMMRDEPLEG